MRAAIGAKAISLWRAHVRVSALLVALRVRAIRAYNSKRDRFTPTRTVPAVLYNYPIRAADAPRASYRRDIIVVAPLRRRLDRK